MNTNNNEKNLEKNSENEEGNNSETTTIVFETEAGEPFAEVELSNEEYNALLSDAANKGITFHELILQAIEDQVVRTEKERAVEPKDD